LPIRTTGAGQLRQFVFALERRASSEVSDSVSGGSVCQRGEFLKVATQCAQDNERGDQRVAGARRIDQRDRPVGEAELPIHTLEVTRGSRGEGRRESNVVGTPMWPAYALRSIGLLLAVGAVLFLMGALIQINPIWQWGPYHTYLSENGAQPDWYIGWLIGALRLMPNWQLVIDGRTVIPEPLWGGARFRYSSSPSSTLGWRSNGA
jgi:hypothetical protein